MRAPRDYGGFFVTGDEWGLVEIVSTERRSRYERLSAECAEHHKHTKFSLT